jgi:hypothetical protein
VVSIEREVIINIGSQIDTEVEETIDIEVEAEKIGTGITTIKTLLTIVLIEEINTQKVLVVIVVQALRALHHLNHLPLKGKRRRRETKRRREKLDRKFTIEVILIINVERSTHISKEEELVAWMRMLQSYFGMDSNGLQDLNQFLILPKMLQRKLKWPSLVRTNKRMKKE